jgi:hypothetical protein
MKRAIIIMIFARKLFKEKSLKIDLHLVTHWHEKISDVGATRLCCADLCRNHGLLDVDKKIIGATIYEHECEGVHVVCISGMGKR